MHPREAGVHTEEPSVDGREGIRREGVRHSVRIRRELRGHILDRPGVRHGDADIDRLVRDDEFMCFMGHNGQK